MNITLSVSSSISYSSLSPFVSTFFSFVPLCMCVFPYASLISWCFHLDLYGPPIPLSYPSSCVSLSLPVCLFLSQSLPLCVSLFLSPSQSLSTPPSLSPSLSGPLCSSSLLPPPSALSDLLQPPPRASLAAEAVAAGEGEAGAAGVAGLDWGVKSRLSRGGGGQAAALGPCACWARRSAWNPRQGGQGEVPP